MSVSSAPIVSAGIKDLTVCIALRPIGVEVDKVERDPKRSVYGVDVTQHMNVIRAMNDLGILDSSLASSYGFDGTTLCVGPARVFDAKFAPPEPAEPDKPTCTGQWVWRYNQPRSPDIDGIHIFARPFNAGLMLAYQRSKTKTPKEAFAAHRGRRMPRVSHLAKRFHSDWRNADGQDLTVRRGRTDRPNRQRDGAIDLIKGGHKRRPLHNLYLYPRKA